ncbi:MAG: styrene monooxygenase/indole monooxygenase family protein [Polyangiaceae bacterium]
MRSIAIIGSGIAGLLTAHGLVRAGYSVTLYSDRTAEQWLHESTPTGTAGRFEGALSYERELGLHYWEHLAPRTTGLHAVFSLTPPNRLLNLTGRIDGAFLSIDVRLQSHRWMHDLTARGGRIVIEPVTVARLDEIAAEHDLTIVAVGKSDLCKLFERDAARSVYDRPQRHVAMLITRKRSATRRPALAPVDVPDQDRFGLRKDEGSADMRLPGMHFVAAKFNALGPLGETLFSPFYHKDTGESWNLIIEAKPGSAMDVFLDVKSGEEALSRFQRLFREHVPWDADFVSDMVLCDPRAWLSGAFAPTVRRPVGRLPSGRLVTAVGDAAMAFDPIGGQGANNGTKMARHLVSSIVARGDRPFDAEWMTGTFDAFFAEHGSPAYTFNNLLLEPPSAPAQELLIAQYGSDGHPSGARQKLADIFSRNFEDPRRFTTDLLDIASTRRLIARTSGAPWWRAAVRGRLGIAKGQLRQKLGLHPGHPLEVT